jgi:hypothetical protein
MCCEGIVKTVKNGQRIATGFAYLAAGVNEELSQKRVKICYNCPRLVGGLVCNLCGCEVHAKTRLPVERCPEKIPRWLAVSPDDHTIEIPYEDLSDQNILK